MSTLQNLSTTAIFFSGVTASTLQYTLQMSSTPLVLAIDLLWLTSLITSTVAAISSQFAIYWWASTYRSPPQHMLPWLAALISRGPVSLLTVAAVTFLSGVICFSFQMSQPSHTFVPVIISVVGLGSLIALATMGMWQLGERYTGDANSFRHQWLILRLSNMWDQYICQRFISPISRLYSKLRPKSLPTIASRDSASPRPRSGTQYTTILGIIPLTLSN